MDLLARPLVKQGRSPLRWGLELNAVLKKEGNIYRLDVWPIHIHISIVFIAFIESYEVLTHLELGGLNPSLRLGLMGWIQLYVQSIMSWRKILPNGHTIGKVRRLFGMIDFSGY
jgi:hypothetical protein